MKVIVQTVKEASCTVEGKITGAIKAGYVLLVGFQTADDLNKVKMMAAKIVKLRILEDEQGKMNLDIKAVGGKILSISQFTLYGDCSKGRRPGFDKAMPYQKAEELYKAFNEALKAYDIDVQTGIFGAHMDIALINEGPKTFILEE